MRTLSELKKEHNDLEDQVFTLVSDGGLTRTEVMAMSNVERTGWIRRMIKREKDRKEAADKAKKGP